MSDVCSTESFITPANCTRIVQNLFRNNKMNISSLLKRAARVSLAILFIFSGISKLLSPDTASAFAQLIFPVSSQFSLGIIVFLCLIEIGIGYMLFVGKNLMLASLITSFILVASILAGSLLMSNPVSCGCFGGFLESKTDEVFLLRNLFFLGVSLFVLKNALHLESQLLQDGKSYAKTNRISS